MQEPLCQFGRPISTLKDQENVASLQAPDAQDMATVQILQDLSCQSNNNQEDLVTSLRLQSKNSRTMLYSSKKKIEALAFEHKIKMVQL